MKAGKKLRKTVSWKLMREREWSFGTEMASCDFCKKGTGLTSWSAMKSFVDGVRQDNRHGV